MNLVIFTEEPSMKELLAILLPNLISEPNTFQIIPHNGISDLRRSLPRKLQTWKTPNTHFLITVDQDSSDCKARKAEFDGICRRFRRSDEYSVRIVCRELEAWFLGDAEAVMRSGLPGAGRLNAYRNRDICMNPDLVDKPSRRLAEILGDYQKVTGAKAIGPHLDVKANNSGSFRSFLSKVAQFAA